MSPLVHRIPRQFRNNLTKHLGIFLLIAFAIAFVSGFLTGAASIDRLIEELPEKYDLEHGRVTVSSPLDDRQIEVAESGELSPSDRETLGLSDEGGGSGDYQRLSLYNLFSRDLPITVPDDALSSGETILRLYPSRDTIDKAALHDGSLPATDREIALDTTFSRVHGIEVGDTVQVEGRSLTVCGLITLPDYTTLFKKNTDVLMDDLTFCVGVATPRGYEAFSGHPETYTYGFLFDDPDLDLSDRTDAERDLVRALSLAGAHITDLVDVDDNKGVTFAPEDTKGDSTMYRVFFYVIIVIMAFVFVVVTGANIEEESPVIGTLLASGFSKGEILRHYLVLPVISAVLAAVVGNLAQFYFVDWTRRAYYDSYSLPPFVLSHDWGVFVQTTIVPVVLLVAITWFGLTRKLKYSPLAFLRSETSRTRAHREVRLPDRLPFATRLRMRVLLANVGSVVTIFAGIFLAGVLLLMGIGVLPLVDNVAGKMASSLPADHIYTLKSSRELPSQDADAAQQAEKLEMAGLYVPKKWDGGSMKATVYGIQEGSAYWTGLDVSDGAVLIGEGLAKKCALGAEDELALSNPYEDKEYSTEITGVVGDATDMNVYMSRATLNLLLGNDEDHFNGWVSDEELHFDAEDVLTDLTPSDMTKVADQMHASMGGVMTLILISALVIFVVVIFLVSKTVMERSSRAVSQLKVFGYFDGELSRIFVRAITVCVVLALTVSIPLLQYSLGFVMDLGTLSYDVTFVISLPWTVYAQYFALGLACYTAVALYNRVYLTRLTLALALKSQE